MTDFPAEMTPDLERILGMPNFVAGPFAHRFRAAGQDIPRKSEKEQAFVIHWLTRLYLEHGERWHEVAAQELKAADAKASPERDKKKNAGGANG